MNPAHLRIGSLEVVAAMGVYAIAAVVPRRRGVPYADAAAHLRIELDVVERGNGRRFESPCPVLVGRSSTAQLVLMDSEVSRRHAQFQEQGGIVYVSDVGSRNGTFLNGERLDGAVEVRPGDAIDVGATRITFVGSAPWA